MCETLMLSCDTYVYPGTVLLRENKPACEGQVLIYKIISFTKAMLYQDTKYLHNQAKLI